MTQTRHVLDLGDLDFRRRQRVKSGSLCLRMPRCQMIGMIMSVGAGTEKRVIEVGVQVVNLQEPHQMHRIQATGEPAIRFIDVIADRLSTGDAFFGDFDRPAAMLHIGHQIRHVFRLRGSIPQ